MKKLLILSAISLVIGCTNQSSQQYQTRISQDEKACSLLQQLPHEIKTLSIQLLEIEQKLSETKSNSDLLTNPSGWLNAFNTEDQLESKRNQISNDLNVKKKVYEALLQTDNTKCHGQADKNTLKKYCGIIAVASKHIALARDNGMPIYEARQNIQNITAKINNYIPLSQSMIVDTNKNVELLINGAYENPKVSPDIFQSRIQEGCDSS